MRLRSLLLISLCTVVTAPAEATAQAQPGAKACTLPPPMICPPDPPKGPRTVTKLDEFIKGIDLSIGSIAAATSGWTASAGAIATIGTYTDELTRYRREVADYRDKISPVVGQAEEAVPAPPPPPPYE